MKGKRQEKILEIIKDQIILTQDDLQNALNSAGFKVTQSTVSRDIKELCLFKGHDSNGNYRYISGDRTGSDQPLSHYREIIARSVISVESALNDIVIKCYSGMAQSVCVAVDSMFSGKMLGSIAGDDTIFVITQSVDNAFLLCDEIKKML